MEDLTEVLFSTHGNIYSPKAVLALLYYTLHKLPQHKAHLSIKDLDLAMNNPMKISYILDERAGCVILQCKGELNEEDKN